MECQSTAGPGAAPASVAACVISASPLEAGWPGSLVREDHREVSPLARGGLSSVGGLTSYPPRCGAAFACSRILPVLPCRPLLREAFPHLVGVRGREDNRVATFRRCTRVG